MLNSDEESNTLSLMLAILLVVVGIVYTLFSSRLVPHPSPVPVRVHESHPTSTKSKGLITTHFNERQMRLHQSLPSRNNARTITICLDALLNRKDMITWIHPDMTKILCDFLAIGDVYILCKVEKEDQNVRQSIQTIFKTCDKLQPHHILFCSTNVGKIAFVRQLEPQVHIEVDLTTVQELSKHVPRIVHVVPRGTPTDQHHVTESLPSYIESICAM